MSKIPRPERIDSEDPGSFLLVGKLEAFHEGLLLGPLEGQEFIKLDSFQNEPTWIPQKS